MMLITLSCQAPNAPEIGYLLAKNPASVFVREFSAGKVWVFYPDVSDDRITVALLAEIDVVGLVRGPAAFSRLDQYINDRPYVASSLTSVALRTAFSTALAGRNSQHTERVNERLAWEVQIPSVACDGGEDLITRVFAPLGYAVTTTRLPLDARFPAWGQADLYHLILRGNQTVKDLLNHLYVLLPVLDNSKHYYVGMDEASKLLAHGGAWLAAHPERHLITRRYLRYKRPLVESALDRLAASAPELAEALEADAVAETADSQEEAAPESAPEAPAAEPDTPAIGLHQQRLQAVIEAVRSCGAHSLLDLGCGEGRLLEIALKERRLKRILGIDVSSGALARARKRLRLDTLPQAQRERIQIEQGSLLYRDRRLAGFDAAALVEVVEHLDPPRLAAMEQVVFAHARPRRVVVTTPNREYNVRFPNFDEGRLRHADHRFEWTRAEFRAWGERVAQRFGYACTHSELGPRDEEVGALSQMIIFDRRAADDGEPSNDESNGARSDG